tara:strand:- start:4136 stop:4507 length:372 start_codon:yes stop_codon:yes gene_type:complete
MQTVTLPDIVSEEACTMPDLKVGLRPDDVALRFQEHTDRMNARAVAIEAADHRGAIRLARAEVHRLRRTARIGGPDEDTKEDIEDLMGSIAILQRHDREFRKSLKYIKAARARFARANGIALD